MTALAKASQQEDQFKLVTYHVIDISNNLAEIKSGTFELEDWESIIETDDKCWEIVEELPGGPWNFDGAFADSTLTTYLFDWDEGTFVAGLEKCPNEIWLRTEKYSGSV